MDPPTPHLVAEVWTTGVAIGFDLETTGADPFTDRPVSFALVTYERGEAIASTTGLVDSGIDIHPEAQAIHGISRARAASEGRPVDEVAVEIADAIDAAGRAGVPVVGMNLSFDLTMLDAALGAVGDGLRRRGWDGPALDCLILDKQMDRYRKGKRKLADLCGIYGVDLSGAHDARADADAAVRLARAIVGRFPELGALDLAAITEMQRAWKREQTEGLSDYFVSMGRAPIPLHEHEWPIMTPPEGRA